MKPSPQAAPKALAAATAKALAAAATQDRRRLPLTASAEYDGVALGLSMAHAWVMGGRRGAHDQR
jgi:hypothetical protein